MPYSVNLSLPPNSAATAVPGFELTLLLTFTSEMNLVNSFQIYEQKRK